MSVASQAGEFELHHHVQDGGSTDETVALLERWAGMVEYGVLPTLCRKFTFSYSVEPDAGMYDALVKAFARHDGDPADWIGWINADDILMPGAAASLAAVDGTFSAQAVTWVGGRVRVMRNHLVIAEHDRPLAAPLIQEGLCDGLHFDFVQQEGMFFRRALWDRIDPERELGRFKLAGDWNLWRVFAHFAELHQLDWPLGEFQSREGQKSGLDRRAYYAEIERIMPFEARTEALQKIAAAPPERLRLRNSWADNALSLVREDMAPALEIWTSQRAGRRQEFVAEELVDVRASRRAPGEKAPRRSGPVRTGGDDGPPRILVHDGDWQFPAITEQHAFKMAEKHLPGGGLTYLAFPWATLIDLRNNFKSSDELQDKLDRLAQDIPETVPVVTVCQHIHLKRIIGVMERAGVTDVFWTHATKDETRIGGVNIHPFPLYPVQTPEEAKPLSEREHLFSFIGAKPDRWYLTDVRAWILDGLAEDKRGLVIGRDSWHYEKIVYDLQIKQTGAAPETLVDNEASTVFKQVLADSVFALCPSGSGPNSIRLWEAIGAGAIPVVLADTWRAPGLGALWREACVFCPETEADVKALPDRLEAMRADPDLMARKRKAVEQLWTQYGPDGFVTDIVEMAYKQANKQSAASRGAARSRAPLKVHLYGRHKMRIPMSYSAMRPYFADSMWFVDDPLHADILVVGFDLDLRENASEILSFIDAKPSMRIVVLSEEPLWDTIWGSGYTERDSHVLLNERSTPVTVLNHVTSDIFKFDRIPYYVTTQDSFAQRYRRALSAACEVSASARLELWKQAPVHTAFFAEKREGERFTFTDAANGVEGLCDYRTRFAVALGEAEGVVREGVGWSTDKPRQSLPDWHLDKLVGLSDRTRVLSALENTHQRDYMTEKFFDAYAVGAMPVYYASPDHRVSAFADRHGYINVYGATAEEAAARAAAFEPTRETADAWLEAAVGLRDLFSDPETLFAERRRVAEAVIKELQALGETSLAPTG